LILTDETESPRSVGAVSFERKSLYWRECPGIVYPDGTLVKVGRQGLFAVWGQRFSSPLGVEWSLHPWVVVEPCHEFVEK